MWKIVNLLIMAGSLCECMVFFDMYMQTKRGYTEFIVATGLVFIISAAAFIRQLERESHGR